MSQGVVGGQQKEGPARGLISARAAREAAPSVTGSVSSQVNQSGGLLVTGFEDGVVRMLELFNPQRLPTPSRGPVMDAELRLNQAFKPHNAPVTAVAYDRNGEILATGVSRSRRSQTWCLMGQQDDFREKWSDLIKNYDQDD